MTIEEARYWDVVVESWEKMRRKRCGGCNTYKKDGCTDLCLLLVKA